MIEILIFAFAAAAGLFFYLGVAGRDVRIMRIFFIFVGLLLVYGLFTTSATMTIGYIVPANTANIIAPYESQASISSMTTELYVYGYAALTSAFFYMALEIILWLMEVVKLANIRKKNKREFKDGYESVE